MAVTKWSSRNSHVAGGMKNGTDSLEDGLMAAYKAKHVVPWDPARHKDQHRMVPRGAVGTIATGHRRVALLAGGRRGGQEAPVS